MSEQSTRYDDAVKLIRQGWALHVRQGKAWLTPPAPPFGHLKIPTRLAERIIKQPWIVSRPRLLKSQPIDEAIWAYNPIAEVQHEQEAQ